jgi:hypothetical protein
MDTAVNYWAVILCGLVAMLIGFLWYGPAFGAKWREMMGIKAADMEAAQKDPAGMYRSYGIMLAGSLVMAFVLSRGIAFGNAYLGAWDVATSLISAFWFWLGFIAPVTLGPVLWEKKPWMLWALNAGYYLATLLAMAAIIALWR